MRKMIVGLMVLLIAAGGAFAQGLTLSGEVFAGVNVAIGDGYYDEPVFGLHSGQGESLRFNLTGTLNNEAENLGFMFQLRTNVNSGGVGIPFFHAAYGWASIFNNMVTVNAGIIYLPGFATGGGIDTHMGMHENTGIRVDISPLDGLTLGLGVFARRGFSHIETVAPEQIDFRNAKINAAFNYHLPDLLRVVGAFTTTNWIDPALPTFYDPSYWYNEEWKDMQAAIGVHLLPLQSFGFSTFAVDAEVGGFTMFDEFGWISVGQRVIFEGVQDLELGLRTVQRLPVGRSSEAEIGLTFIVHGIYRGLANGNISPRFDFAFDIGSGFRGLNLAATRLPWDSLGRTARHAGYSDTMNMLIRPSVEFRLGPNRLFEIGYTGQFDFSEPALDTGTIHNIWLLARFGF